MKLSTKIVKSTAPGVRPKDYLSDHPCVNKDCMPFFSETNFVEFVLPMVVTTVTTKEKAPMKSHWVYTVVLRRVFKANVNSWSTSRRTLIKSSCCTQLWLPVRKKNHKKYRGNQLKIHNVVLSHHHFIALVSSFTSLFLPIHVYPIKSNHEEQNMF